MDIYFDESIHDRANFIVLAAVVADSEQIAKAEEALRDCGFLPGVDEFKSSMKMKGNPRAQALRENFQYIVGECKVAVGIIPVSERDELMQLAIKLTEVIGENSNSEEFNIFIDEGIKFRSVPTHLNVRIARNCDSKHVLGIQLADCCAHFLSSMLLGELGLFTKMVPSSRIYPGEEGELELAWELWASMRYALAGANPVGGLDPDGYSEPLMGAYGLVCSEGCTPEVRKAADKRFGTVWVGCIH